MRIGIIAEPLRGRGGIPRYVRRLVDGLRGLVGDDRLLLYDHSPDGDFPELDREVHATPTKRWMKTYGWYPYLALRANGNADLVHNPGQIPHYFRFRKPTIVTVHDLSHRLTPGAYRWRKRLAYALLFRRTLEHADRIIADSQATRGDLIRRMDIPDEKIRVIHLGVDEHFRLAMDPAEARRRLVERGLPVKQPYIFWVGCVGPRKNLDVVLRALDEAPLRALPHRLLVAGAAGPRGEATEARMAAQERVLRVGPVSEEDLPLLYAGASAFVFPSILEGFGLPVVEAMAAGCPCLLADASSLPEIGGAAAVKLDPHDPAAWARALATVLEDDARARSMAAAGRIRAREFSWDRCVRETLAVYHEVGRP